MTHAVTNNNTFILSHLKHVRAQFVFSNKTTYIISASTLQAVVNFFMKEEIDTFFVSEHVSLLLSMRMLICTYICIRIEYLLCNHIIHIIIINSYY